MRISDWSSDVCSSDLAAKDRRQIASDFQGNDANSLSNCSQRGRGAWPLIANADFRDSRRFPEIRIKHEERVSDPQTSSAPGFYLYAIGDERSPRALFPRSRRAHKCPVLRRSCVEWPRNWCSHSASDPYRVDSDATDWKSTRLPSSH